MPDEDEQYLEFPVFNHPSFDTSKNKTDLDKKIADTIKYFFEEYDDSDSIDYEFKDYQQLGFGVLKIMMYRNQYSKEVPIRVVTNPIYYYSPN